MAETRKNFFIGYNKGYRKGYHEAEEHYMNVVDSQHKLVEQVSDIEKEAAEQSSRYIPTKEQNVYARLQRKGYRDGYIVGAKAHLPQWHDLRKDPEDLPKENTLVLSDKGMIVMWRGFSWAEYSPNYDNIKLRKWEEPTAWCEIPKFKE